MITDQPPAFTGAPALTSAQVNAVEMLLGSKQAYFNAKRDKEWACLTAYLNTVLSWVKVVRSFITWPDLLARLGNWNPYREREFRNGFYTKINLGSLTKMTP
ncbi:hypothetical protein PCANC_15220 [Puccinia coronata f. sp. avenae]|uniref:Uncharacterized protein n=1 Tax=Puccinia coronata f. sp. avenae TaxID=200324 RepID=A0A2N5VJ49_9BASI|nr:hypothetical protein PCASD_01245 [Puccinia coronata f. sp. avenae]PLW51565.1 hypothetical protein PCANC_15220 [Puccinia coronata f. sp. avenae]